MKNRVHFSRKFKDSIVIMIIGITLGLLYPILDQEYNQLGPMLTGFFIGLIASGFIVLNEIIYSRAYVKRMKFRALVISKSLIYSIFLILITVVVSSVVRALVSRVGLFDYFNSPNSEFIWNEDLDVIVIYMLASTTLFIFFYQISRKMGQGVLWNFISGKYHKAREEERIFMFMDINNSTALAESLGDIDFNRLLNDFFFDITASILTNYGEIYRYVGDEVVVSWKLQKGLRNAHFIRAFYQAKEDINLKREEYIQRYGLVPSFSAGFHYGKVIVGEIGEVKSQICFFGDVMYETTEIEKSCKKYDTDILLSEPLLKLVELPQIYSATKKGSVEIPGFAPIITYSVSEI